MAVVDSVWTGKSGRGLVCWCEIMMESRGTIKLADSTAGVFCAAICWAARRYPDWIV